MIAAGAGYLATVERQPIPTVEREDWQTPEDVLPEPGAPLPPIGAAAIEASARLDEPARHDCKVTLVGQGKVPEHGVVAILSRKTGAAFACRPIGGMDLPCEIEFTAIPCDDHWAVFAHDQAHVRFTYLDRAPVHRNERGAWVARLRGQAYGLTVQLIADTPETRIAHVPLSIRRPDDPNWRYWKLQAGADTPPGLITDDTGKMTFHLLGAGRYRVRPRTLRKDDADVTSWHQVRIDQDRVLKLSGIR